MMHLVTWVDPSRSQPCVEGQVGRCNRGTWVSEDQGVTSQSTDREHTPDASIQRHWWRVRLARDVKVDACNAVTVECSLDAPGLVVGVRFDG